MNRLDIETYRRINKSFTRKMVYHVGVDSGFFVEMNYMINAMLYCLSKDIQFQLYSVDANFATGLGWSEYFLPFCDEIHDSFHHKYNFHRLPSWSRIIRLSWHQRSIGVIAWKIKSILNSLIGHVLAFWTYGEYVYLNQDVSLCYDDNYFIPVLDFRGTYSDAYTLLAKMIWKLHPSILQQKEYYKKVLDISSVYDGIQIRTGDKRGETELIDGVRIMQKLNPEENVCVFVLSDNYQQILKLRASYPQVKILTLCRTTENGYHHQEFCRLSDVEKKEAIVRLLISVDILLESRSFVGSITTGPSVFIMKQRLSEPLVQAVDCPKSELAFSLFQTIDIRGAISRRYSCFPLEPILR